MSTCVVYMSVLFVQGRKFTRVGHLLIRVRQNVPVQNVYWLFKTITLCLSPAMLQRFESGRVIVIMYVQLLWVSSHKDEWNGELKSLVRKWRSTRKSSSTSMTHASQYHQSPVPQAHCQPTSSICTLETRVLKEISIRVGDLFFISLRTCLFYIKFIFKI